ncbi:MULTISPECIES: XTP/dITP diphosphatase [unclassified Ligilactobacillus]|uniref:XTP/dITP diphosphatase n=1 Tax=unclassified Ligilactobacillus TaxID=2767920 RepID=UPI003853B433
MKKTVVVATGNAGKAREYAALFAPKGLTVKTLADFNDVPVIHETGTTLRENAMIKAQTIAEALTIPVLADDTGLFVDALNGEPGVYTARYAGDHDDAANRAKLLTNLVGVPVEERTAHFETVIVAVKPDGSAPLIATGRCDGQITLHEQGVAGFGYDSLFYCPKVHATFAETTVAAKNKVSHRGRAMQHLMMQFDEWWN